MIWDEGKKVRLQTFMTGQIGLFFVFILAIMDTSTTTGSIYIWYYVSLIYNTTYIRFVYIRIINGNNNNNGPRHTKYAWPQFEWREREKKKQKCIYNVPLLISINARGLIFLPCMRTMNCLIYTFNVSDT